MPINCFDFPPERCEICSNVIEDKFIAGRLKTGPQGVHKWADMCERCHNRYGVGLGVGNGQIFQRYEDGKFYQVTGK